MQFRYLDNCTPAVILRLYRDAGAVARGDVSGPIFSHSSHRPVPFVDRGILSAEQAYYAAIRVANASDSEIVVTGDATLWNPAWGKLVHGGTTPLISSGLSPHLALPQPT